MIQIVYQWLANELAMMDPEDRPVCLICALILVLGFSIGLFS